MIAPTATEQPSSLPVRAMLVVAVALVAGLWWWFGDDVAPPAPAHRSAAGTDADAGTATGAALPVAPQAASREVIGEMAAGTWPLVVKVVDANGDPVAAAAIELHQTRRGGGAIAGRTDAEGICSLAIDRERVWVRARHSRIGRSLLVAADEAEFHNARLRLLLWRPVRVAGIVLTADGRPWPKAQVSIEPRQILYGSKSPHVWPSRVVTDAAGRFSFEAAAHVPGFARLSMPGFENIDAEWVAKEGAQVVLAVPGAFRIEGTIVDPSGNPIRARAFLKHEDDYRSGAQLPVAAERFTLEPKGIGKWQVSAVPEDASGGEMIAVADVELTMERPRAYVELRMEKLGDVPDVVVEEPSSTKDQFFSGMSGARPPKPPPSPPLMAVEVFGPDGKPVDGIIMHRACELGEVRNYRCGTFDGHRAVLTEKHLSMRPMRILVFDKAQTAHGWIDVSDGRVPPNLTVHLGAKSSVVFEARCRGRAARGVHLRL